MFKKAQNQEDSKYMYVSKKPTLGKDAERQNNMEITRQFQTPLILQI